MANEDRAQAALVVEIGFERKNAEHQIQPTRHLLDATAIPRPNLGTDVVNDFLRRFFPQRASKAQVEPGIIDQHDRVRFAYSDFAQSLAKLFSKITVVLDHF